MLGPKEDAEHFAQRVFAYLLAAGRLDPADAAAKASGGDPLFYGAMRHLAVADMDGEIQLAEPLRAWVSAALKTQPKLKRARRLETNLFRDICLTMLVQEVRDRFGLTTTGRSYRRQSACGVVAEAAGLERGTVWKAVRKFINQI